MEIAPEAGPRQRRYDFQPRWRLGRALARRLGRFSVPNRASAFEKLPRDHQTLDFAGPFANGAQLDITIEFLDRIVLDEAVASVNLQRIVADTHGRLRREQFGHR